MSRGSVFCFIVLAIFGSSRSYEDVSATPSCEDRGPQDIYLNFSRMGLDRLARSFASSSLIKCLNLEGNRIHSIHPEAFIGLPELHYLNFAGNQISHQDFIQTTLPNLKTLILDGPFDYNDRGWDYEQRLYSSRSFLLPELETLSLRYYGNNEYFPIHRDAFINVLDAPKLSHLHLSGNGLSSISNLLAFPNLTTLSLDDNKMEFIPGEHLQNLEVLSVDRNKITNLCWSFCNSDSWTLRGMHNLRHLSLAGNKIDVIESEAFVDLGNLVVLNLDANKIEHFPPHTFDNMRSLKNLSLDENRLTSIPTICAMTKLEFISLNGNPIAWVDETNFCSLLKLAVIKLRNNVLTSIPEGSFADLPSLAELDLSRNMIHTISKKWIAPHSRLKFLDLDGNQFTDTRNMSLEGLDSIESVRIGNNPIKIISVGSLLEWSPNITIDVSRVYEPKAVCNTNREVGWN